MGKIAEMARRLAGLLAPLRARDEDLPGWLRDLLTYMVAAPFAIPLFWRGIAGALGGRLEPLAGPKFGQCWVGCSELTGAAAHWGGWSLVAGGLSFAMAASAYSRWGMEPGRRVWIWGGVGVAIVVHVLLSRRALALAALAVHGG